MKRRSDPFDILPDMPCPLRTGDDDEEALLDDTSIFGGGGQSSNHFKDNRAGSGGKAVADTSTKFSTSSNVSSSFQSAAAASSTSCHFGAIRQIVEPRFKHTRQDKNLRKPRNDHTVSESASVSKLAEERETADITTGQVDENVDVKLDRDRDSRDASDGDMHSYFAKFFDKDLDLGLERTFGTFEVSNQSMKSGRSSNSSSSQAVSNQGTRTPGSAAPMIVDTMEAELEQGGGSNNYTSPFTLRKQAQSPRTFQVASTLANILPVSPESAADYHHQMASVPPHQPTQRAAALYRSSIISQVQNGDENDGVGQNTGRVPAAKASASVAAKAQQPTLHISPSNVGAKSGRFYWNEALHKYFLLTVFEFGLEQNRSDQLLKLLQDEYGVPKGVLEASQVQIQIEYARMNHADTQKIMKEHIELSLKFAHLNAPVNETKGGLPKLRTFPIIIGAIPFVPGPDGTTMKNPIAEVNFTAVKIPKALVPVGYNRRFLAALFDIGLSQIRPRMILEKMVQVCPTITHGSVKAHLQKYRKLCKQTRDKLQLYLFNFSISPEEIQALSVNQILAL